MNIFFPFQSRSKTLIGMCFPSVLVGKRIYKMIIRGDKNKLFSQSLCSTESKNIRFISGRWWEVLPLEQYFGPKIISISKINGCLCWDTDVSLDTKIGQIDLHHISMSNASFVRIWHFMLNYPHDIKIWHKTICSILVSKEPYVFGICRA